MSIRKLANCDGCTTTIAVTLPGADCFKLCTRTETVIGLARSLADNAIRLRENLLVLRAANLSRVS